jgi:hypothetical protein
MEDDQDFDEEEDFDDDEEEEKETPTMKEDIYGRTIDAKGNVVKNNSSKKNRRSSFDNNITRESRLSSAVLLI